jgi:hypothetical protein
MLQSVDNKDEQAKAWLRQFSQELDLDENVQKMTPLEDVREELRALGADVSGFHKKLARTLQQAKLARAAQAVIAWISPCWQPQWAGQPVGAGDIPTQQQTFPLEDGRVEVSCTWRPQSGTNPAYLDLTWNADTIIGGELWCRFVQPDTQVVLNEILLGESREGGHYLTPQTLGFDPSTEKWALTLLLKARPDR